MFDQRFIDWALANFGPPSDPASTDWTVRVNASLPEERRIGTVEVDGGPRLIAVTPAVAAKAGILDGQSLDDAAWSGALARSGEALAGADNLFTYRLGHVPDGSADTDVRALTAADADAFAAFQATCANEERDEADVELDHWAIYGVMLDGEIVAAASAYPFADSPVADIGVITSPPHRGAGHAAAVVRVLSGHILDRGLLPLYRCQLENHASAATARSAGLTRFGQRDSVA